MGVSGLEWRPANEDRSGGAPPTPPLRSELPSTFCGYAPNRATLAFRGHYEHSLDAKHRLSIPARFRAAFSSGIVLARDADACITVWTPEVHEGTVAHALAGRNPFSREYKQVQRYFQGNAFDAELDSAGRVTLPPPLLAHAGIEKDVVVTGVGGNLEVWSRERWDEQQQDLERQIGEVTGALGHPS